MATQVQFSTDDLPPNERVRSWCDFFAKHAHSITPSRIPELDTFRAQASGWAAGGFVLLQVRSGLERVQRTAADVARDKTAAFFIRRYRRPVTWRVTRGSMPAVLMHAAGDFCVSSTEFGFDRESEGPALFEMLVIPKDALAPLLTGGRLRRPFRLPGASPLGSLLGAAMDAATAQAPLLADALGEAVLHNLCGLVALVCSASDEGTEEGGDGEDSIRTAQLAAVKRHIDSHLADPNLTPASAAAEFGMSARQLHRLFQPSGATFARYVLRQRLLRCRETIAGATGTGRSVIDIAFGWGFNSMATFYRAFVRDFWRLANRAARPAPAPHGRGGGIVSPAQQRLVRTTFAKLAVMPEVAGALFYERLFADNPDFRPLFKNDMRVQGVKLMTMLAIIVYDLPAPGQARPGVRDLAARHVEYGVKLADYQSVGEALLWTLEQALGTAFTRPVREAWTVCYGELSSEMMAAVGV